ncbi:hypothetical protein ACS25B_14520, partial [Dickeya dadantii subsp. dieffenbachiae]
RLVWLLIAESGSISGKIILRQRKQSVKSERMFYKIKPRSRKNETLFLQYRYNKAIGRDDG